MHEGNFTMRQILARSALKVAAFSLIAVQIPVAQAAETPSSGVPALAILAKAAATTKQPVMVSQPVVQQLPGDPPRAAPVAAPPPPPANETDKERKARLKAEAKALKLAEKAEKDRLKKEEKERKRAENKAKGGSSTGKKILGCLGGGLLLGGLTALLGGNRKQVAAAAAAGCVTGFAFAALSKKENADLEAYVNDDFMVQDETCSRQWQSAESGQTANISCGQETVQQVKHTFAAADDVVFDQANFVAKESVKYASTSLRIRNAPTTADAANIVGAYDPGDKILTYGTTLDGAWTYVMEKGADGKYSLLGYVSSEYLASKPPASRAATTQYARLKPPPPPVSKNPKSRRAVAVVAAPAAPRATRTIVAVANTRCKSANVSVGKQSATKVGCGGAQLAYDLTGPRKEMKA